MHMIGIIGTTWTSEADELAGQHLTSTSTTTSTSTGTLNKMEYKLEAKDVLPHKPHAGRQKGQKCRFLSLVTWTFDFELQTHPNEVRNMSSA